MEIQPFFIEFLYNNDHEIAEVKPCCEKQADVFYYDIYMRNQYQFTITPTIDEEQSSSWKISLKNADKNIEKGLIDVIGREIEKKFIDFSIVFG